MLFEWWRHVIFFFLGIIENLINFACALVHIYPRLDIQLPYWSSTLDRAKSRYLKRLKKNG